MPLLPSVPASAASSVKFASTFEPQHPKLTYTHVETRKDPVVGSVEVYRFSNGMEFYGVQRKDVPLVSFGELVKVGMVDERDKENGVSHFLEHLIFKGSKYLKPGEFDRKIEDLGGSINAFTSNDETFYYTYDLPKESLREAITLRAEFIQNAIIPPEELEKERTTVISEIGMYEGKPMFVANNAMQKMVWDDSPLRRDILGPRKVIASIPREDILNYYYQHYAPENRAIVMVGDFDLKEALEGIAEEYNVPFPAPEKITRNKPQRKPLLAETQEIRLTRDLQQAILGIGFDGPRGPYSPRDVAAFSLLEKVLAGGASSRLYQDLVEEKQLAYSVGNYLYSTRTRSMFNVFTKQDPKHTGEVQQIILEHLRQIVQKGVSEAELNKAQKLLERELANDVGTQLDFTGTLAHVLGEEKWDFSFGNLMKEAAAVTSQDIQRVAKQYLGKNQARTVALGPPAQKNKPGSTPPPSLQFGGALADQQASKTLANGAEVLVQHRPNALDTAISIDVKRSPSLQAPTGAIELLSALMNRRIASQSAKDFQERLAQEGIELGVSADSEHFHLGLSGSAQDTEKLYQIAQALLQEGPGFEQEDLDLVRTKAIYAAQSTLDQSPLYHSLDGVKKLLFPGSHPLGITTEERIEGYKQVDLDTLKALRKELFQPRNMAIAVSGPVQLKDLAQQASQWLSGLKNPNSQRKQTQASPPPALSTEQMTTKAVKSLDEMPLSEIVRGWHAPGFKQEDNATLRVLLSVLRGGMSSRLIQTFREGEHGGLCYSVSALSRNTQQDGMLAFYIGTEHQNVPLVLRLFQNEVDKLLKEPPSPEEMKRAKLQLKSSYLSSNQLATHQAALLASHRLFDTPSQAEALEQFDAVTAEDIQAFAQKYLSKPSATGITAPQEALDKLFPKPPLELLGIEYH
jgi:zinc protease